MLRIVLLGKSKVGKSSVGNILLGEDVFIPSNVPQNNVNWATRGEMEVIETSSMGQGDHETMAVLSGELRGMCGGVNAFALIVNVNEHKIDNILQNSLKVWESTFSKSFWGHLCVIFTHCDEELEDEWAARVQGCKDMCRALGRKFEIAAPRAFFVSTKADEGEWGNIFNFIKTKNQFHCPNLYSSPAKRRRTRTGTDPLSSSNLKL